MPSLNLNAQLFYKDENIAIHNIMDEQIGRYFLSIPTNLYQNFTMLINFKGRDLSTININDINTRNQLINSLSMVNNLIKNLNTNMVFSRTNQLKELPINDLINILNPNQPFNQGMYINIIKNIENIIVEDYNLMISPNLKQISTEQAIALISQKEQDVNFINWLRNNLININDYSNLDILRQEYKNSLQNNQQNINNNLMYDISEYKEVINNGKRFIIGLTSNNQMVNVEIPENFKNNNMLELFQIEYNTINDKTKLANLTPKQVATVLFDKIVNDTKAKPMTNNFEVNNFNNNPQNTVEQNVLNNAVNQKDESYLVDKENNIAVNQNDNTVMAVERNDENKIVLNEAQAQTYEYNEEKGQPQEIPMQVQENVKKRVLVPPKKDYGFIKIGTIFLFVSSFILTIISLVLLISS